MKKIIIIAILIVCITEGVGVTYSAYRSEASTKTNVVSLAAFVFDTDRKELINIPISNVKPGDDLEYKFAVSNNSKTKKSDVSIKYNIILKTMHFIPLDIKLYDKDNNLVLECDEKSKRNELNELECSSEDIIMSYEKDITDEYNLKLTFSKDYDTEEYSSLVDYLNLEIKSTQKID